MEDKLEFSHKYHLEEEEMECTDCHDSVENSTTGFDDLLPDKEVCAECHEVEEKDECSTCHTNSATAVNISRIKDYSQLFSHEKHLGEDLNCEDCHGDVTEIEKNEHAAIPDMLVCMDCHQSNSVAENCLTCHTIDEQLLPTNHNLAFTEHSHGDFAGMEFININNNKTCNTCHKVEFCQNCHQGENLDRFSHPLNFEFTHALNTQGKEKNCITCHEERSFCSSCHVENNVMPHNHTAGWANSMLGNGGRHSFEATIDLDNCMSCHERNAQETCGSIGCHFE
ncbi:MAG: cytochrome c3 family protein [Gammaproteobacteria bacterium]|nr:cytochrome c3 family protein [Gammaproteobacteria bacterium]